MSTAMTGPEISSSDFQGSGIWWLPDNPEHQVAGTLKYSHGDRFTLTLIGNLFALNTPQDDPIVLFGSFEGKQITLFNCFQTQSNLSWATYGHTQETYACFGAFIGLHEGRGLDFEVNNVTFRTLRTPSLLNGPNFEFDRTPHEIGMRLALPTYPEIHLNTKATLKLQCLPRFQTNNFSKKITLDLPWTIQSVAFRSIRTMLDEYVNPFVLLSTIINNTEDYLTRIESSVGEEKPNIFEIYIFEYERRIDFERTRPHEQFFNLSKFESFSDIINKWFEIYKTERDAFNQFFANRYHSSPLGEDEFLRIIRAVENWEDGQFGRKEHLKDSRFPMLLDKLREVFSSEEIEILGGLPPGRDVLASKLSHFCSELPELIAQAISAWPNFIERAKITRHSITHSVHKSKDFKAIELRLATTLLETIFKVKVMIQLGRTDQEITNFLQNSKEFRYLNTNIHNNL